MLYCPTCNSPVDDNATYCPNCGTQFMSQEEYQQYLLQQQAQAQYQQPPQQQYQQPPQQTTPPAKKKSKVGLIAAIGAVAIVAVLAIVLLGGKDSTGGAAAGGDNGDKAGAAATAPTEVKLPDSVGLEFRSNGDGTCTWIGRGTCTDTVIVVPEKNGEETVVAVAEETLDFTVKDVTKVVFPKTMKTVEKNAFGRIRSVETVILNEGLETIAENAFYGCEGLKEIKFPSTLKSIGEWAFSGCVELTEVHLPEGLTELGKFAFNECRKIKKITIPSTLNDLYFISDLGGNNGFQFETVSIEEINIAGNWNYTTMTMDAVEVDGKLAIYFYGRLTQDLSVHEYPGSYYEIPESQWENVICALLNKNSLIINGKKCNFQSEKPTGRYYVPGKYGFVVQEFTQDGTLNVSYDHYLSNRDIENAVCGPYTFDSDINAYCYSQTQTVMGETISIEKIFINFGQQFIWSIDAETGDSRAYVQRWVPYSGILEGFIPEDAEVEEEKVQDVVATKEDLLAALVAAFKKEGITVTVNNETGELAMDSSILFGGDSADLTKEGKAFLNKFVSAYTSVIFSPKFDGLVAKTMVEGHTALLKGSTYQSGLPLSEKRAKAVMEYCASGDTGVDTSRLAPMMEAVGMSNSKPIYKTDGSVDKSASRRVCFRFILDLSKF